MYIFGITQAPIQNNGATFTVLTFPRPSLKNMPQPLIRSMWTYHVKSSASEKRTSIISIIAAGTRCFMTPTNIHTNIQFVYREKSSSIVQVVSRFFTIHFPTAPHSIPLSFRQLNFCFCYVSFRSASHSGAFVAILKRCSQISQMSCFLNSWRWSNYWSKMWKQTHTTDLAPKTLTEISRRLH